MTLSGCRCLCRAVGPGRCRSCPRHVARTLQVLKRIDVGLLGGVDQFVTLPAQTADDELAVEHVHLAADGFDVEFLGHVLFLRCVITPRVRSTSPWGMGSANNHLCPRVRYSEPWGYGFAYGVKHLSYSNSAPSRASAANGCPAQELSRGHPLFPPPAEAHQFLHSPSPVKTRSRSLATMSEPLVPSKVPIASLAL